LEGAGRDGILWPSTRRRAKTGPRCRLKLKWRSIYEVAAATKDVDGPALNFCGIKHSPFMGVLKRYRHHF